MLKKLLIIVVALEYLVGLEIVPENPKFSYINPKYFRYLNLTVQQYDSHGPYYWNYKAESTVELGNNVLNNLEISLLGEDGKYHPTPLKISTKSCDFLEKEHVIGKTLAQVVAKANYKCPFAPGEYEISNFTLNLDSIPEIGLLTDTGKLKVRCKYEAHIITDQKEPLLSSEMYITVQKNKN